MRGNNRTSPGPPFITSSSPATTLQSFIQARYRAYRNLFHTPFWTEGWALYWEMRL